jgi:hypothetical protein
VHAEGRPQVSGLVLRWDAVKLAGRGSDLLSLQLARQLCLCALVAKHCCQAKVSEGVRCVVHSRIVVPVQSVVACTPREAFSKDVGIPFWVETGWITNTS